MTDWTPLSVSLPEDGQRVLCHVPGNRVFLPGKTGASEERTVMVLRFAHEFFLKNPSRTGQQGSPHFWLGEGTRNHFFQEVSHWMPLPEAP